MKNEPLKGQVRIPGYHKGVLYMFHPEDVIKGAKTGSPAVFVGHLKAAINGLKLELTRLSVEKLRLSNKARKEGHLYIAVSDQAGSSTLSYVKEIIDKWLKCGDD